MSPTQPPGDAAARIDAYLAALPEDQRAALVRLRTIVSRAVPEAVDGITYGLPAYRYRGRPLLAYRASSGFCSLFPMGPETIEVYRAELAGFDLSKGTIRFDAGHQLPEALLTSIALDRKARIDQALATRRGGPGRSGSGQR